MILAIGKSPSAPSVAPMSRARIFAASEARCQSEDCTKLHTLRIGENWPHFRQLILTGRCRHPSAAPSKKVTSRIEAVAAIAATSRKFKLE
jgi:hypothetical protein